MSATRKRRPKTPWLESAFVQEVGERGSCLGTVLYVKIRRHDDKPMPWSDVWATFADRYPNQWAVQVFPPRSNLVDEANIYHLFVLPEDGHPLGLDISRRLT